MEHVLELQELDTPANDGGGHGGGGGAISGLSLLLCGGSTLSVVTCL
jgi:Lanthionine-containing peptide SapB precursor RamS